MRFACAIERQDFGRWHVRHQGPDVGRVEATAATREEALEKMRAELRYRLELCPCSGQSYQYIQIDLDDA